MIGERSCNKIMVLSYPGPRKIGIKTLEIPIIPKVNPKPIKRINSIDVLILSLISVILFCMNRYATLAVNTLFKAEKVIDFAILIIFVACS